MKNANRTKPVSKRNAVRIIVAAASARAIAASSLRAGRAVSTIDLFADADTAAICRESDRFLLPDQAPNFSMRCNSLDQVFERLQSCLGEKASQDGSSPPTVLIGGGLENYFRSHTASHKLTEQPGVGTFNETALVRNVVEFCRANSIRFPAITRKFTVGQTERGWLVKTDFSSGGLGVETAQSNAVLEPDQYFQKYIAGKSISACYVAAPQVEGEEFPNVEMLGVCEPFSSSLAEGHRLDSGQPSPFRYAGSIGPTDHSSFPAVALAEFKRVGCLAARHFGIVGVFGIDFVLERENLWMLEINPRITASAEIIELSARQTMPSFSIVQLHLDALAGNVNGTFPLIEPSRSGDARRRVFAKRIVYRYHDAARTLRVTQSHLNSLASQFGGFAEAVELPPVFGAAWITDVPGPETDIVAGHPVLTLHVFGESQLEADQALTRSIQVIETLLGERLL